MQQNAVILWMKEQINALPPDEWMNEQKHLILCADYERVKELGKLMGIEISYATYEKIKDHYSADAPDYAGGIFF